MVKSLVEALQDLITTFIVLLPTTTICAAQPAYLSANSANANTAPVSWASPAVFHHCFRVLDPSLSPAWLQRFRPPSHQLVLDNSAAPQLITNDKLRPTSTNGDFIKPPQPWNITWSLHEWQGDGYVCVCVCVAVLYLPEESWMTCLKVVYSGAAGWWVSVIQLLFITPGQHGEASTGSD